MSPKWPATSLVAGLFLLTVACVGLQPHQPSPIAGKHIKPTAVQVTATTTQAQPSPSPSPQLTPSATATLEEIPTQQEPTSTPVPTLSPDEARALVADLLTTNAGCRLPCWWGLTPGQTPWQAAKHFLHSFSLGVYESDSTGPVRYATVKIPTPEGVQMYPVQDYGIRDGLVDSIKIDDPGPAPAFAFVEFVNTYGSPEEVWIRTYNEGVREVPPPFETVLFYPNQGIVAAFDVEGAVQGHKVRACPQRGRRPALGLWSPEHQVTFYEAADMFMWDRQDWAFLPLAEATGMDVEAFYETFSDPDNTTCLETPADLWTPQF